MKTIQNNSIPFFGLIVLLLSGCVGSQIAPNEAKTALPASYATGVDTMNNAQQSWRTFFTDKDLQQLIDSALLRNQELNILMQEIEIARNETRAKRGEYLPKVSVGVSAGMEKPGRFTRDGAVESSLPIRGNQAFPDPLSDFGLNTHLSWEVDIWRKLRNSKKAAVYRYLSTEQGKNFMVTHLVSEIAAAYYELLALDNQLQTVQQNIELQSNVLSIVRLEKEATRVTELAVRKFEAEVYHTQSRLFALQQRRVEVENRIHFLTGTFPHQLQRYTGGFVDLKLSPINAGIPGQLLQNRPDIRQAEFQLAAAKLDVKSARAQFYPGLNITAGAGLQAFRLNYLTTAPESFVYNAAGELVAPLINRAAIKAAWKNANARQIQAITSYEQTILKAYLEVVNQLSNAEKLHSQFEFVSKQVEALSQSVTIANGLFTSARADYMEVLMTQRDLIESKLELIEVKKQELEAGIQVYKAIGGGYK